MKFTNTAGIPPLLAGWLSIDEYDYCADAKTVSATTLLKPLRQMILSKRYRALDSATIDVSTLVASSIGTAVHDSVERIWKQHLPQILINLGIPKALHAKYVINPTQLEKGMRPIYLEQRNTRMCGEWTVSGKFDAVIDGEVNDIKFTGTYSYVSESKGDDYAIQGSVYRWINPDIIIKPTIRINFLFGDFDKKEAYKPNYPKAASAEKQYELYEVEDTGNWIAERIQLIQKFILAPEPELPECTPDDLWMGAPTFKYYKNPEKRSRSTANFDTEEEALARKIADGNVGVIVTVLAEPKACYYCDGFALCSQKNAYIEQGILKL